MVTVVVSDGVTFTMEQDVAFQCGLIADFAGGGGEHLTIVQWHVRRQPVLGDQEEPIPIQAVNSTVMRKV